MRHQPTSISIEVLGLLAGTPYWPAIIDVRIDEDLDAIPFALPRSRHLPHSLIGDFVPSGPDPVVVVCHRGLKLSQGAAAHLRTRGIHAANLKGGAVAWQAAGLPTVAIPDRETWKRNLRQSWCAPARPQAATMASIWLIRRFLDANAAVLFVEPDQVDGAADRFGATRLPDHPCELGSFAGSLGITHRRLAAFSAGIAAAMPVLDGLRRLHLDDLALTEAALPVFDGLHQSVTDDA